MQPGTLVDPGADAVRVDGRSVAPAAPRRTLVVNKPPGVVSTRRDPQGRPTVLDLVDDPAGLYPVGRLDADSRGLILLTDDGDLALRLTHPRYGVTKRYRAVVGRSVDRAALRRLAAGVELEDGWARPLEVRAVGAGGGRGGSRVLEIVMGEGRSREVRRMCAAAGLPVADLRRIALGPLHIGRLHEGHARRLTAAETDALYAAAGLPVPSR